MKYEHQYAWTACGFRSVRHGDGLKLEWFEEKIMPVDASIIRAKLATSGDTVTLTREEADALREVAAKWLDPEAPVPPDGLEAAKERMHEFGHKWSQVLGGDWRERGGPFAVELGTLYATIFEAEREACAKLAISVAAGFGFSKPVHLTLATKIAARIRGRGLRG